MPESELVYLNGEMVRADEAAISPLAAGFLWGRGVFETLIAYSGRPFAVGRHEARLLEGAMRLGIAPPGEGEFGAAIEAVLAARGGHGDCRLRVTLAEADPSPTLLVTAGALPPHPATAAVTLSESTRNPLSPLAGVKSISYAGNLVALQAAKEMGADEALLLTPDGLVSEGCSSNLFLVQAGQIVTPSLESGCLPGVTREIVLEICAAAGLACEEADLPAERLREAGEVFLTSSLREIQPVREIDGRPLAAPGEMTREVQRLFAGEKAGFLAGGG